jgi:hypothetical protein
VKKTVCVDVDGVLADYHQGFRGLNIIGDPIKGAREFMRELCDSYYVVVYTTRCKTFPEGARGPEGQVETGRSDAHVLVNLIVNWLERHDIPYDEVYIGQGKPFAAAYVDDRAVCCQPQDLHAETEFAVALKRIKALCGD